MPIPFIECSVAVAFVVQWLTVSLFNSVKMVLQPAIEKLLFLFQRFFEDFKAFCRFHGSIIFIVIVIGIAHILIIHAEVEARIIVEDSFGSAFFVLSAVIAITFVYRSVDLHFLFPFNSATRRRMYSSGYGI